MRMLVAALPLVLSAICPGSTLAQDGRAQKPLAAQLVDGFSAIFGAHPGARVNHTKGVILTGTFTPSEAAASVSKAAHFQPHAKEIPVTVRFSDGSGLPDVPDGNEMTRGMAVKFALPDGTQTDIVVLSVNGFPVATSEEFRDFLAALKASGPDAAKPTPFEKFLQSHPAAKAFVQTPKPPPLSFGTIPYFGINSFKFTNAAGTTTFGRYQLRPAAGEEFLSKDEAARLGPDYLVDEIGERVKRAPAKFRFLLQVAEPGDKIDDPSVTWPDSRKTIELGTIAITTATSESRTADKLLFLPGNLVPGIEAADPMIAVRSAAYPISFVRRLKTP
jgi:catalase